MELTDFSQKALKEVGVSLFADGIIDDYNRVAELTKMVKNKMEIPSGVYYKIIYTREIPDQKKYENVMELPDFIHFGYEEITDRYSISLIKDYYKKNQKYPQLVSMSIKTTEGIDKNVFYDLSKPPVFREDFYRFYEKRSLTFDEMQLQLEIIKIKAINKNNSILNYFQVLSVISLVILFLSIFISIFVMAVTNV